MKLNENQFQFIINSNVEQIAFYLQEDYGLSVIEALDKIYNSKIYDKLLNSQTGLYLQSPDYIYDYLKAEIEQCHKGNMAL